MRRGVLCAGALTVDRVKRIAGWPQEEGLAEILGEDRQGGASSFNMAVDLVKLGADFPVAVQGLVGEDADGLFIRETLAGHGVDISSIASSDAAPSSYTEVMSDAATGRRTFFHRPGTNAVMGPEHLDVSGSNARYLHLGMPGIHERLDRPDGGHASGWVTVLRAARAAGMKTNVELVTLPAERIAAAARPLLPHLDLLIVNDAEIGATAGVRTVDGGRTDAAACLAAARAVMAAGAMELAVVHFPMGAIAVARDGAVVAQPSVAAPPEAVAGANGAGDAFAAGVLLALHGRQGLREALVLGHAAAAASLRALSTVGSVEPADACLALAARWGWRDPLPLDHPS
ncbi:MAG: carbohydrate kinase family protein [Burkholderiales bacterium]|nr:carbohydrate kinase family protein [Burkholderiales bacterium]